MALGQFVLQAQQHAHFPQGENGDAEQKQNRQQHQHTAVGKRCVVDRRADQQGNIENGAEKKAGIQHFLTGGKNRLRGGFQNAENAGINEKNGEEQDIPDGEHRQFDQTKAVGGHGDNRIKRIEHIKAHVFPMKFYGMLQRGNDLYQKNRGKQEG